jgi:uncharacterized protein
MDQIAETDSPIRAALAYCWDAQAAYIAGGRKDFGAMAAALHPEIVLEQPASLPYGGVWRGHQGLREWLEAMDAAWSSVEVEEPEIIQAGETAIVEALFRGTARESGEVAAMPICEVIRFAGGLPVFWRVFYFDTAAVLRALGAASVGAPPGWD